MSNETRAPSQSSSDIPAGDTSLSPALASGAPAPDLSSYDEEEYVEALAMEIEALTLEAKALLERSARLSAKMRDLRRHQSRRELSIVGR